MPAWADVLAFAEDAEELGLDSVWVCDHFLSEPPGQPPEGIYEGWTILSALAATTKRVEVGALVMCVSFRNPALLAKMAATADTVARGRLILGLGAGWYDPEYEAFGYPTDHRVTRFEDALRIIRPLLRGESVTVTGRFHRVADASLLPPPERPIPLLVAATAPRMLRLTARYADAWNTAWFGLPDERLRQQMAALEAALEHEGRDPSTLRRTVGVEVLDSNVTSSDVGESGLAASTDALAHAIDAYEALAQPPRRDALARGQLVSEVEPHQCPAPSGRNPSLRVKVLSSSEKLPLSRDFQADARTRTGDPSLRGKDK
jgi:alkanesulfonate monooxygenase SsuD/methylene tetrahydromethanopterin reductase-like flavin-dependent oxidoreductase (luciferase family)